jgi:hypothetical protein
MFALWGNADKRVFQAGDRLLRTNMIASGEFMTITQNNMTNLANSRAIEEVLWRDNRDLMFGLLKVFEGFMGDDSVEIDRKTKAENASAFSTSFSSDELDIIRTVAEKVSAENGLKLSKNKTSVRCFYYEYLKKMAIYGWIIPRLAQLMLLTSERPSFRDPVIETFRSFSGFVKEYVSRGGDYTFSRLWLHHMWNLKRRVRYSDKGLVSFYTMPFPVIWTPIELGGIGQLPWSMLGANTDVIMYQLYDGDMLDACSYCAHVLDVGSDVLRKKIASEVLETSEVFNVGRSFLEAQMVDSVRRRSEEAVEWLRSHKFPTPGNLSYVNQARRLVERAVSEQGKLQQIVKEEKQSDVNKMVDRERDAQDHDSVDHILFPYPRLVDQFKYAVRGAIGHRFAGPGASGVYCRKMGHALHIVHVMPETVPSSKRDGLIVVGFSDEDEMSHSVTTLMSKHIIIPYDMFVMDIGVFIDQLNAKSSVGAIKDYMEIKYGWQKSFLLERSHIVEPKYPLCPVAGQGNWVSTLLRTVGMSSSGDDLAVDMTKAAAKLSRDATLPKDITAEVLFKITTHPSIRNDMEAIARTLVAMGASPANAGQFASEIFQRSSEFSFFDKTQSFSTRDMIIGHMDLSRENYNRFVSVTDSVTDRRLEEFLRAAGFLFCMVSPEDLVQHINVRIIGSKLNETASELLGPLHNSDLQYFRLYPDGIL